MASPVAAQPPNLRVDPRDGASVSIDGLSLRYGGPQGVAALTDVSLAVRPGDAVAIIGETGSGKSSLIHSLLGLLPRDCGIDGRVSVSLGDAEVEPLRLNAAQARTFRREHISFIPQLTRKALVPVLKVEEHFRQFATSTADWRDKAVTRLADVGLPRPEQVMGSYPHQLSGGMAQRVCIALAMVGGGELVIADEPTSGLDALVKRRVADLLQRTLTYERSTLLLVTHDLYLARRMSTRIAVMYGGFLVESAGTEEFFERPLHPYSQALLGSLPEPGRPLAILPGAAPRGTMRQTRCVFFDRCRVKDHRCEEAVPALREVEPGRLVASWCVDR